MKLKISSDFSIDEVDNLILRFRSNYKNLAQYQHQVVWNEWRHKQAPFPVDGFNVSATLTGVLSPLLLEWPTTNLTQALNDYRKWVGKIGTTMHGAGLLRTVDLALGSWCLDMTDFGEIEDRAFESEICWQLQQGRFPDFQWT